MRYKNILLVSPRFYKGRFRLSAHPLAGLGYIAESLKNNGFTVNVVDMNLQCNYSYLRRKIDNFKPHIIGFTAMTFGYRDLYSMIDKIKQSYPKIKIAAGGPHISMLRDKVLTDCQSVDYGIVLEGDRSIVELCRGDNLDRIQGLIYRKGGDIISNNFNQFIADLDSMPFPKYDSFELERYPVKQIGIVTSRGCPYSCIYCPVVSAIGKQFRYRSAQSVLEEIIYFYNKAYKTILMLDDNFTLLRPRVEELCELIIRQGFKDLSLKCPNGIRADRVDRELLKLMKRAGFDMLAFGVEAASDRVLKNIKKGEDIATVEENIKNACDLGFDTDLFFIIGSPGETVEDVKKSFSLAERYPIRNASFYNIIPFPTTELFDWLSTNGYLLYPQEDIMNNASHYINEPSFFTPEMSAGDRRMAFRMGQKTSRSIRRKFIERELTGPIFLRKIFSMFYTIPFVNKMMTDNRLIVVFKEKLKKLI